MKVLLVSSSSGSRGGGELCLLYLGQALRERGHEPSLWVSRDGHMDELAELFRPHGPVVRSAYRNTYRRRGRSLAAWLDRATAGRVAEEWRDLAPDILHLNKQNLEDGLDLVTAAGQSGLPALAMIHITQSARYLRAAFASLRDGIARRVLRSFPGLLVTTPGSRERDLQEFLGTGARVRSVANGVPIPSAAELAGQRMAVRRELRLTPQELLVVAVGRMVEQKRPLLALELAERLVRAIPEARFLWIGDGPLAAAWDARVAAHGMRERIQRLAWQQNVPRLLSGADAFLHSAEFEGLSFAILEALAAGLPCAITPNLLVEMPLLNPGNSIAIDSDVEWIEALRDSERRRGIGDAGRAVADAEYSFSRMAAEYEKLYGELQSAGELPEDGYSAP